jgi:hypothetical protein
MRLNPHWSPERLDAGQRAGSASDPTRGWGWHGGQPKVVPPNRSLSYRVMGHPTMGHTLRSASLGNCVMVPVS